jgi:excisionase family DNA binding protein
VREANLPRLLFTRDECARVLGISRRKFDQIVAEKLIAVRRIGRRVFVHKDILEKFARGK